MNKNIKKTRVLTDDLPIWDHEQLKLFSMVSREFVLPLAFVKQATSLLEDGNLSGEDRQQLSKMAKNQLDDYLELSQAVQQIYYGAFQPLPLEPVNPAAVVADAMQKTLPLWQQAGYKINTKYHDSSLVLANRQALTQALGTLIKYVEMVRSSKVKTGKLLVEVKAKTETILINITDTKSQLTRAQVKRSLDLSGKQKQVDYSSLDSALNLVVAQNLSKQMNGKLDFNRHRGRAQWTISLPRSRQLALWT